MEGGDEGNGSSGGSRWNPTKEQITILESLYKQGLRTPTAEQIQQISNRLRDFGHIEGKNVFYWFQNHKARLRQKQKQENLAYFNTFLHPILPSPYHHHHPQVICGSPCYSLAQSSTKNHQQFVYQKQQQYQKQMQITGVRGMKRSRGITEEQSSNLNANQYKETLDLFPVHPTGILEESMAERERDEGDEEEGWVSVGFKGNH